MFAIFALVMFIQKIYFMSTALIVILSIVGVALIIVEGIICGKITSELVHKKDKDINEVMWFWFGFIMTWAAILLTLVVKKNNDKE